MRPFAGLLLSAAIALAGDATTPLLDAAAKNDFAKAKALLKAGANPNETNR